MDRDPDRLETARPGRGRPVHESGLFDYRWLWPTAIWLSATFATCIARPPLVSIESPLLAAAWWSWQGHDVVSYLSASPSNHPPLLPWLIQAGWYFLGPSEVWARIAANLFGLGTLWLTVPLARLLWPEDADVRRLAPVILAGSGGFLAYAAMSLNTLPLMFASVALLIGLLKAWRRGFVRDWAIVAGAIGLGHLASGAIALQFLLPMAIVPPIAYRAEPSSQVLRRWLAGCACSIVVGCGLAAVGHVAAGGTNESLGAWLQWLFSPLPAAGGDVRRPWYWYAILVPLAFYPWLWWRTLWRAIGRGLVDLHRPAYQLCVMTAAVALLAAAINGRYSYLILPILPPLALLAAGFLSAHAGKPRDFHAAVPGLMALFMCLFFFLLNIVPVAHLDALWREISGFGLPIWLGGISLAAGITLLAGSYLLTLLTPRGLGARVVQLAMLPLLLQITVNLEFIGNLRPYFDLSPTAQRLAEIQKEGRPVAILGQYDGAFDFIGRLSEPLNVLADRDAAVQWARTHDNGVVLSFFAGSILYLPAQPLYLGNAEDRRAALWSAAAVVSSNGVVLNSQF
jgi:hypothetical protein